MLPIWISKAELEEKARANHIEKITVMYQPENYLFFNYPNDEDMSNVLVAEDREGNIYFSEGFTCGYDGEGPSATENILRALDMDFDDVNKLKYSNGFRACFDENGTYLKGKSTVGMPFDSRISEKRSIRYISSRMIANLEKKQLYFMDTSGDAMLSLIKTLSILDINEIQIYIGQENHLYFPFSLPHVPKYIMSNRKCKKILSGPFLRIDAIPFDVIIFLGVEFPVSIVNTVLSFLGKEPLFREMYHSEKMVIMSDDTAYRSQSKIGKTVRFFTALRKPKDLYQVIEIHKQGNRGMLK